MRTDGVEIFTGIAVEFQNRRGIPARYVEVPVTSEPECLRSDEAGAVPYEHIGCAAGLVWIARGGLARNIEGNYFVGARGPDVQPIIRTKRKREAAVEPFEIVSSYVTCDGARLSGELQDGCVGGGVEIAVRSKRKI